MKPSDSNRSERGGRRCPAGWLSAPGRWRVVGTRSLLQLPVVGLSATRGLARLHRARRRADLARRERLMRFALAATALLLTACATTPPSASTCAQWSAAPAAAQATCPAGNRRVATSADVFAQEGRRAPPLAAAEALVTVDQAYAGSARRLLGDGAVSCAHRTRLCPARANAIRPRVAQPARQLHGRHPSAPRRPTPPAGFCASRASASVGGEGRASSMAR